MQDTSWMQSTAPLPVRTIPNPWEDLPSLISRASANMGYQNPIWILSPQDIGHIIWTQRLLPLRNAKDYRLLELLLSLDEEAVYKLTFHRFALQLQAPEKSHSGALDEVHRPFIAYTTQVSFFHPHYSTQVCPQCLDEKERYGRLYWHLFYLLICPRHGSALVDRCPVCHSSIPALRPSLSICPRCKKGDYRAAPIKVLFDDPFFSAGYAIMLSHLGIENLVKECVSSVLSGSPLLELLPWQYFQLLHAFRYILAELAPDTPFLRASTEQRKMLRPLSTGHRGLSHDEGAVLIATFHFLFASWPDNFFALLETLPHQRLELPKRKTSSTTGLFRDFGRLYKTWLYHRLKDPAYSFLHEAFADYLKKRYAGGYLRPDYLPYRGQKGASVLQRAYMPVVYVMKTLGVSGGTIEKLVEEGLLCLHKKAMGKRGKRSLILIERSSVEELRAEWEKFVTFETVATECLGTRDAHLYALMDAELLVPERGPKIDGYSQYLYKRTTVEQFMRSLLAIAVKSEFSSQEGLPLSQAGSWLGGKLTLATTVAEILRGQLIPTDLENGRPLFQRLFLPRSEMNRFREKRNKWRREELGWLTEREAAASLGVYVGVLLHWMESGLIVGEMRTLETVWRIPMLIFTKESLNAFRQTYAFTEEVAALLDVTRSTVEQYVRQGILHPVVGRSTPQGGGRMLFLREEVLSLLPPGSLSLHEAMALLGVSATQLYSLLSTKRLPCFVPPGGHRASLRFFRSDLEAYWLEQVEFYRRLLSRIASEFAEGGNTWLLTRDVASLIEVSGATVRNWINQMQWTVRKETVGAVNTYYVNKEDLARYIQVLLEKAEQMVMRVRARTTMTENGTPVGG